MLIIFQTMAQRWTNVSLLDGIVHTILTSCKNIAAFSGVDLGGQGGLSPPKNKVGDRGAITPPIFRKCNYKLTHLKRMSKREREDERPDETP